MLKKREESEFTPIGGSAIKKQRKQLDREFEKIKMKEQRDRLIWILDDLRKRNVDYEELDSPEPDNTTLVFKDGDSQKKGELHLKIHFEDQINFTVGVVKSIGFKDMIRVAAENIDTNFDDAIMQIVMYWKEQITP